MVLNLNREPDSDAVGTDIHPSPVHSCAREVAHDGPPIGVHSQHHNGSPGLVFSKKAAGSAANDQNRVFLLVGLHVDSGSVPGVPADEDLSSPHGIARGIAHIPVDHDPACVHGVPHRVLGVPENLNLRTVQIRSQSISRDSGNGDPFVRHSRSKEPVTQAVDDPAVALLPQHGIQGGIIHIPGI